MTKQPVLETPRLRLRPLEDSDRPAIQQAAAARAISDTMISIPHPYPVDEARRYIAKKQAERSAGLSYAFVIADKKEGNFCGIVEVRDIDREHLVGELSFWLTVDVWGRGYMSEVIGAVVRYGFEDLQLNRLYAYYMLRNHASERVLERNGFKKEGLLRQCVQKWGQFEDVALCAILRQEWQGARTGAGG